MTQKLCYKLARNMVKELPWSDENHHDIQQVPLYSIEIWTWCAGVYGNSD